jgi:DNA polymerase
MRSGRISEARLLAARYFGQLSETGETEIYLDPEDARALRGDAPSGDAPSVGVSSGDAPSVDVSPGDAPVGSAPAASACVSGKDKGAAEVENRAADAPEIVRVKLAFTRESTTGDMFAGETALDALGTLEEVEGATAGCTNCELANGRTNIVFGVGNPKATLMFVGEAPGREEDLQGIPFVGRAGRLLDKILEAAEIERDDVYIANIIKCRPPNNRTPLTNEIEACMPYLGRQVAVICPRIICTLGLPATQTILGIRGSMGSLRGKVYVEGDIKVIPTYHPAAALRDPKYKRPIWDDIRLVKREYEL